MRILFVLLFLSVSARADVLFSAGAGKGIIEASGTPFERVGEIGYQLNLPEDLFVRADALAYLSGGYGQSSAYFGALVGVKAQSSLGPELHIAFGPGYLTNPDYVVLGGPMQFNLEGGIGLIDSNNKTYLGLVWNHLSSASLYPINQGRDFIMIQWRILTL